MELSTFIGNVYGIYMIVTGFVLVIYFNELAEAMEEFQQSKMLFYLAGQFIFVLGLLVVVSHTRFEGGLLPIVVSVLGYLTLLKGLLILFLPHTVINILVNFFNKRVWYIVGGLISVIAGFGLLFMTIVIDMIA